MSRGSSTKIGQDILPEDMAENPAIPSSSPYSKKACFDLLTNDYQHSSLPFECERFDEIKAAVKRRNTDPKVQEDEAYAGLSHGDRVNAIRARERGQLNHHQIQRRMTTSTHKNKIWSGKW